MLGLMSEMRRVKVQRQAAEAETRIGMLVAENLQRQMASTRISQTPAPSTSQLPTIPTPAPTAEQILSDLASWVADPEARMMEPFKATPEQWESLQKLPMAPTGLGPKGMAQASTPEDLIFKAMIYGMAVMLVEPEPPMTATEVRALQARWE
jgi:hypothetical protein